MSGSFTLEGVTTFYHCYETTTCAGGIDLAGWLTLPDFGASPPSEVTLTAPFTSQGGIEDFIGGDEQTLEFTGAGIATITLQEAGALGQYRFASAVYDFQPIPAIPEPGTMCLIGLGLVTVAATFRANWCWRTW